MNSKYHKTKEEQEGEQRLLQMYEKFLGQGAKLSPEDESKYQELRRMYGKVNINARELYKSIGVNPLGVGRINPYGISTEDMFKMVNEYTAKTGKPPGEIMTAFQQAQSQYLDLQKAKYGTSVQISPQVQIDQKAVQQQSQLYNQVKKQAEVETKARVSQIQSPGTESKIGFKGLVKKIFGASKDITLI